MVETPQEEVSRQARSMTLLSPHSGTGAQIPAGIPCRSPAGRSSDASRRDGETSPSSASGPSLKRERQHNSRSLVHPKEAMITCGRRGVGWEGKDARGRQIRQPDVAPGPREARVGQCTREERSPLLACNQAPWLGFSLFRQTLSQR